MSEIEETFVVHKDDPRARCDFCFRMRMPCYKYGQICQRCQKWGENCVQTRPCTYLNLETSTPVNPGQRKSCSLLQILVLITIPSCDKGEYLDGTNLVDSNSISFDSCGGSQDYLHLLLVAALHQGLYNLLSNAGSGTSLSPKWCKRYNWNQGEVNAPFGLQFRATQQNGSEGNRLLSYNIESNPTPCDSQHFGVETFAGWYEPGPNGSVGSVTSTFTEPKSDAAFSGPCPAGAEQAFGAFRRGHNLFEIRFNLLDGSFRIPLITKFFKLNSDERPYEPSKTSSNVQKKDQYRVLQNTFEENNEPSLDQRKQLAALFGMPQKMLRIWFKNQRQKKKQDAQPIYYMPERSEVFAMCHDDEKDDESASGYITVPILKPRRGTVDTGMMKEYVPILAVKELEWTATGTDPNRREFSLGFITAFAALLASVVASNER
ncbi:hypothetical protein K435DRAFT_803177 [Dendrothele bispora CBS 962.96]|uniref:Homeobox domain-containing protein n=1 Tax=Dendrothele bispora (strain CBS 962.96) TaxID=1314807 RepID=A0A4S8LJT8_DENBC|nr:hypothetical protein K435DRAFT_803177 [Dendrothele bispora CBS 962.96]